MPLFSLTPKKSDPIAIFDIGGGGVSAVLVSGRDNDRRILWSDRLPLAFGVHENFKLFTRETFSLLDRVVHKIVTVHPGQFESIHCVLSSAWHIAESSRLHLSDLQKIGINDNTIPRLTAQSLSRHLTQHGGEGFELVPLDDVILLTEADGQIISNLGPDKPNTLTIHHFTSSTDKNIKQQFTDRLKAKLSNLEPIFHSNILATYAVTKKVLAEVESFIILDVAGELTDVTIVRGHTISNILSFPMGKYTIARLLAEKTGQSPASSYSTIKMWSEGLLDSREQRRLTDNLAETKEEWLFLLNEAIHTEKSSDNGIPIVVIGDDSASLMIGQWSQEIEKISPIVLNHEFFADLYPERRTETKDISVLLAGLFARQYL